MDRYYQGDRQAITEALNMIHWRSLKRRNGVLENGSYQKKIERISFVDAVKIGKESAQDGKEATKEKEWIIVESKKHRKSRKSAEKLACTIFLYDIPDNLMAREVLGDV